MNESMIPGPMLRALADIDAWLDARGVPYVLIGGMAASVLGRPRTTQDIDVLAVIEEGLWDDFAASAPQHGFIARIEDPLDFARRSRVLLMRHAATGVPADIVLAGLSFEKDLIARGRRLPVADTSVMLPQPEDLIVMKAVAGRPHDVADIEGILEVQTRIDWNRVLHWGGEFAAALDASDIIRTLERLRAGRR